MAICPVCKMQVDESKVKITSEYKGKKYYYLSDEYKKMFDFNLGKYLDE